MLPDRVSNPGPLTYESGALPIALRGPAILKKLLCLRKQTLCHKCCFFFVNKTCDWDRIAGLSVPCPSHKKL